MARAIDADAYLEDLKESYEKLEKIRDSIQCENEKRICEGQLLTFAECAMRLSEQPTIEPKQEWISVNERLPKKGEVVLGYLERSIYRMNYPHTEPMVFVFIDTLGKWKRAYGADTVDYDVTHWMPLPEPPEKNNEEEQA